MSDELDRGVARDTASGYSPEEVRIGIFGSHSALPTGYAAKKAGFDTVLYVKDGREETYVRHNDALFDDVFVLDDWEELLSDENQDWMRENDVVFVPNRSFVVYAGLEAIEGEFEVPIYGSRRLLRAEERDASPPRNQYHLMEAAGLRYPEVFEDPGDIDRLSVVKVQQKDNPLERAYFYPSDPGEYREMAEDKISRGEISREGLERATIEEFVVGPMLNANFHSYALDTFRNRLDLLGFSDREQTNETGFRRLPADLQLDLSRGGLTRTNEEICHRGKTLRESKLGMVYGYAKDLLDALEEEVPPGMIGPIGIQGALPTDEGGRPEFVVFDLSFRVPGDPAMGPTSPYLRYLDAKHSSVSDEFMPEGWKIEEPLDPSMMELKRAANEGRLEEVVT